jgi:hypothetical protein
MTDNTLEIITPPGMFGPSADDDLLDTALRVIGVAFGDPAEWASKYGTDFENDVFMMHRYCWCESDDCQWCGGGAANFWFKPTGFRVRWYKYIGRGVEVDGELPRDFMQTIFISHPAGMTLAEGVAAFEREAEAVAEGFQRMLADLCAATPSPPDRRPEQ